MQLELLQLFALQFLRIILCLFDSGINIILYAFVLECQFVVFQLLQLYPGLEVLQLLQQQPLALLGVLQHLYLQREGLQLLLLRDFVADLLVELFGHFNLASQLLLVSLQSGHYLLKGFLLGFDCFEICV